MDVEGIEFELLERIMADGTHKLIDEVGRKDVMKSKRRTVCNPVPGLTELKHFSLPSYRYLLRFITTTRTCAHLGGTCSNIPEAMRRPYLPRRETWAFISTRGLKSHWGMRQGKCNTIFYTSNL